MLAADLQNDWMVILAGGYMSLWNLYDTQSPVDAVSLDHTVTVRFAHPLADPELPREMSKTAPIVTGGDSQENHGENRGEGNGESYKGFREMSLVKSGSATSSPSHSHSQTATSQSFHTMMQESFSRDDPSPLRTKRADGDGESPERSRLSPERSVPSPDSSVSREIAASRNLPTPDRNTLRETLEPMMQELRTYIHRELSDLKGDMVRQFCEQERIIQEQQEEIERLLKRLNQGG